MQQFVQHYAQKRSRNPAKVSVRGFCSGVTLHRAQSPAATGTTTPGTSQVSTQTKLPREYEALQAWDCRDDRASCQGWGSGR